MAFPELVSYIAEQTQAGVAAEVLRQSLMESGWHEIDIDNAFHDVAAGLNPLTEGSSLHEDVSQVRTMVTHLASRIKNLEAALASSGTLPMQAELLPGTGTPSRTLIAESSDNVQLAANVIAAAVAVACSWGLLTVFLNESTSILNKELLGLAIGAAALIGSLVMKRFRYVWSSAILLGSATVTWVLTVWISWMMNKAMESTTAFALFVLILVIAGVLGNRLDRS